MKTAEPRGRQQWTIYVDDATPDVAPEAITAAVAFLAGRDRDHQPAVQVVAEDIGDLIYVDGLGWTCPTCWAHSDGTDPGSLSYVETVGEARHVDLGQSTATSLYVYGASTEGWDEHGLDPRLWCRGCLTRYAVPDGVELDWH